MAQFSNLSLTTKGLALQTKAQTGVQLNFTKVQFGDGSLATGETVANLTALKSVKLTTAIASNIVIGDGTSQIRTILNNSGLATGFYLREVGVFAQDPDEGEILYEYAMAGEYADYIPAGTGNSVFESTLDLIAIIGNASNVTATIQSGAYTSQLDFEERNAESTGYGVISGGEVTAQSTPNMSVNVSAINADLPSGKKATQNQNTVSIDASDSTKPRTDIVYAKSDGTIGYLKSGLGTAAVAGKETYTVGTNAVGAIAGSKAYTINTNAVGAVAGSNTYTVGTNFVANDTVEFDGITFTALASGATGNEFNVGASTTESATNLASALNANSTINSLYNVSASNGVVTITEKTASGGNTPGSMTTTSTGKITVGTAINSKVADTVTIDGVTFTAVSSNATGNEFNIGLDATATAANLVSSINANATINATYMATSNENVITLAEKTKGGGNTPGDMTVTGTITITNGTATTSKSADTVTINGITFTVTESTTDSTHFAIGADTTATATNLASALNSNSAINALYTATSSINVATLIEKVAGGGHTPTISSTIGTIAITNGTVTNSTVQVYPSVPTTPDGGMLLYEVKVGAGATSITNSDLIDNRIIKLNNNQLGSQLADIAINVKTFGAKGDGITDDTINFQTALDYLGVNGGGKLLIPEGVYIISHINLYSNITLYGSGFLSKIKQKIGALPRGTSPGSNYYEGDGIITCNLDDSQCDNNTNNNKKNITIHDLLIEGNSVESGFFETMAILGMQSVSNVLIENCKFVAPQGDAIAFFSGTSTSLERHCENIIIRHCKFDGVNYENRQGISFYDVDGALVENCTFTQLTKSNMPGAIDFEGRNADYVILRNIKIKGCAFKDIGISGEKYAVGGYFYKTDTNIKPIQNFIIENNSFENCAGVGLGAAIGVSNITSKHNISIRHNTFLNIKANMQFYGLRGLELLGNVIESSPAKILIGIGYGVMDLSIKDNEFKNVATTDNNGSCIELYGITGFDISDNTFVNVGNTDNDKGICIAFEDSVATSSYGNIKNNKVYATNSITKLFFKGSGALSINTIKLLNNKIFNSDLGNAILANAQYFSDIQQTMFGYDVYTASNMPNDFPIGITNFLDEHNNNGYYKTVIVPRIDMYSYQLSYQIFIPNSSINSSVQIRFSNNDGTSWGNFLKYQGEVIGTTAQRPTVDLYVGKRYYDSTLMKPIWWNGINWTDATGATI